MTSRVVLGEDPVQRAPGVTEHLLGGRHLGGGAAAGDLANGVDHLTDPVTQLQQPGVDVLADLLPRGPVAGPGVVDGPSGVGEGALFSVSTTWRSPPTVRSTSSASVPVATIRP